MYLYPARDLEWLFADVLEDPLAGDSSIKG
jgi:hypothetical protein